MSDAGKAVFLSYASQDAEAARRICEALRAAGVEVWFDQSELVGGDAWDQKIRKQIRDCALLIPIISAGTQARTEGYFRLEWRLADQRTHLMAKGRPFLLPVVIDDTRDSDAHVPDSFTEVQWTRLPGGEVTPAFAVRVKKLLDGDTSSVGAALRPDLTSASGHKALSASNRPKWVKPILVSAALVIAVLAVTLVKRDHGGKPAEPAPAPLAGDGAVAVEPSAEKSIAVLAFANLSQDKANEYFSDGISEELLNVLAKVPDLKVTARTSAFYFKGRDLPIQEIARKLNVAYVVEGSVQRAGDKVRISAQLIKASDGYRVWSEHFDRELRDVFALQDEIAGLIAQNLSLKLRAGGPAPVVAVDSQAVELYLQARAAWNLRDEKSVARASQLLDRALEIAPGFARAHAARVDVWLLQEQQAETIGAFEQRDSPGIRRIFAEARRAVELDPECAEAHASLGNTFSRAWQFAAAVQELRRAIELNPSYASAHQWLGMVYGVEGRIDEAVAELRRAVELDPFSHRILDNYAFLQHLLGHYTTALELDERALALRPEATQASTWKARDLSALGRHDEAVALVRRLGSAREPGYQSFAMEVFAAAGLRKEVEEILAAMPPDDGRYGGLMLLGRTDEALAAMNPGKFSITDLSMLLMDPLYDPVRLDPRFAETLATLGATEAHARAQTWRKAHPAGQPETKR